MSQKTLFLDETSDRRKHFPSVFIDEQELLKAIISIHCNDEIELDPMFFKGNFYKDIKRPKHIFDINPQFDYVRKSDAQELPLKTETISSMILDPPFMIATRKSQREYYSSGTHGYYNSFLEMVQSYTGFIKEAYRILTKGGILIFKCQDYTDSKTLMIHCMVYNVAVSNGFYAKDLAILNKPKNKVSNNKLTQRHLRKTHTYFWIFEKIMLPPTPTHNTRHTAEKEGEKHE